MNSKPEGAGAKACWFVGASYGGTDDQTPRFVKEGINPIKASVVQSPGKTRQTVLRFLTGISNIRNPILVSYVAKGLLPYHGLGSGIKRALDVWGEVEFTDDRDGCLFTATVHRKPVAGSGIIDESASDTEQLGRVSPNFTGKGSEKSSEKIVAILKESPKFSARQVADRLGVTPRAVEKQIAALRAAGRLLRIGPAKGGYWEVLD